MRPDSLFQSIGQPHLAFLFGMKAHAGNKRTWPPDTTWYNYVHKLMRTFSRPACCSCMFLYFVAPYPNPPSLIDKRKVKSGVEFWAVPRTASHQSMFPARIWTRGCSTVAPASPFDLVDAHLWHNILTWLTTKKIVLPAFMLMIYSYFKMIQR